MRPSLTAKHVQTEIDHKNKKFRSTQSLNASEFLLLNELKRHGRYLFLNWEKETW